jgi:hypothetical protein
LSLKNGGTSSWKEEKETSWSRINAPEGKMTFLFGLITINRRVIVASALEVLSTSRVRTLLIGGKSPGRDFAE